MAGMTGAGDAHRAGRTVVVRVTSAGDGFEHLVADAAMTLGSAGCFVALCGRAVLAAALICPPGPRCPACIAVRNAVPAGRQRHRRTDRRGTWARLSALLRHPRPARSEPPRFPDVTLPLSSEETPQATRLSREPR